MAYQARAELLDTLKSLLESGDYSDFVITCGTDTYKVHKNVVCTRSGFLKGAERFAVSQEAATAKADLSEDDPVIVKLLVQYLYEGEYDIKLADMTLDCGSAPPEVECQKREDFSYAFPHTCVTGCPNDYKICHHHECRKETCGEACVNFICQECCPSWVLRTESLSTSNPLQLLLSAKMYEIGDKYDVPGLKQLARSKFSFVCAEHWDSVQFAPAAHYAFSTTPENDKGLRDIVTETIAAHMDMLNSPAVEALLHEFNGLAVNLLTIRAKDLGWIKTTG